MNKRIIIPLSIVLLVIAIVLLVQSRDNEQEGSVTIGFIGPLTGDTANIGQNAKAAVEIAVDEVNASGGVDGKELRVIYEDGKCDGKSANLAAAKLINVDHAPLILGGACSGETGGFTDLAEQNKRVVLSYCSSAPKITQGGDYIFRDYPSDTFQGKFAAEYAYTRLKKQNAAVFYIQTEWGTGVKDVFVKEFKNLGGTIVLEEGHANTQRDFRTSIAKLKTSNTDIIYFLGNTEDSAAALKQFKENNINLPILGGDVWDDETLIKLSGPAAEGIQYSKVFAPLNDSFKAKMKEKLGKDEITICSPQAYDAVKITTNVLKDAGTDPEKIKNALYRVKSYRGVSNDNISFDQNGDLLSANFEVKEVRNGKSETISQ